MERSGNSILSPVIGDEEATPAKSISTSPGGYHSRNVMASRKQKKRIQIRKLGQRASVSKTHIEMPQKGIKYLQKEIESYRRMSFDSMMYNLEYLAYDEKFQQILKDMTKRDHLLFYKKFKTKHPDTERKFSNNQTMEAIAFFKKNPKLYRFLCQYLNLPSLKLINNLLSEIKFTSGINPILFKKLKHKFYLVAKSDRVCTLMFGEMLLSPHICYDQHDDKLHGFATNDNKSIAKRAVVFMVKSVGNDLKFEQPLAYYFTNELTKTDLKMMIRTVVEHIVDIGLIIVSMICNDSPLNVTVITQLVNETKMKYLRRGMDWRYDMIRMKRQIMIPLFNITNSLVCIRNHLLTKDLVYIVDNKEKIIKWKYFQKLNDAQGPNETCRLLRNLSEEHVNPKKINKNDPKLAIQLFSQNVAASTHWLIRVGKLDPECQDLIDLTLLLDQLYDTFTSNTTEIKPDNNKYKGPVTIRAPHSKLWSKAKAMLNTVKFIKRCKEGEKMQVTEITVSSITNLIKTIERMEAVCKLLYGKFGFNTLLTNNLNYEPLAKLFENIRRHGKGNNAPNAMEFERGFKASLINTNIDTDLCMLWMSSEETDDNIVYFQTLNFILNKNIDIPSVDEEGDVNFDSNKPCLSIQNNSDQSMIICGWIFKKYMKNMGQSCQSCRKTLLEIKKRNEPLIKGIKYKRKIRPNKYIVKMFEDITNQATTLLRGAVPKTKLKDKIKDIIEISIHPPALCLTHKNYFMKYFMNFALYMIIYRWCRSVNNILRGKNVYVGENVTRMEAQRFFKQNKIVKKKNLY